MKIGYLIYWLSHLLVTSFIGYLIYLLTLLSYGFTIAYCLSHQIKAALKPYKIIYKILTKQGVRFQIN